MELDDKLRPVTSPSPPDMTAMEIIRRMMEAVKKPVRRDVVNAVIPPECMVSVVEIDGHEIPLDLQADGPDHAGKIIGSVARSMVDVVDQATALHHDNVFLEFMG